MQVRRRELILIVMVAVICAACNAPSQSADKTKKDSVDRDYSGELPRIPPVEPAQALKTFAVAPGFRIELAAAEPLVTDPIAMAFDENSRLFVVEMRGYSEDGEKNLGRIRLLEDTNDDGKFDKSTIYTDGLSWPTAVTCYDGGIFVGAAPNIHYFKDTDGDGKADIRKIVYTGFGRGNVQGLLNTFKWGLDNRIHGATSSSGAVVEVRGQKPEVSGKTAGKLSIRGRDFAFDPKTFKIEATSGGGQHGLSFNQWGEKFVCSNSNHIQHVLFEDRYIARNPYLAASSPRRMIASDGPQADVFRSSQVEPWRVVRTRLRVKGVVPGPIERGGKAAGYFTGATGITMYRGDAWPAEFQGYAIIGDVGSNLVHRKRLDRRGVSYLGVRVDEKKEFITSTDIWFRPVQFANAPDGALYIADMYRETIEHPKSLPPPIKKHLDLTSGRDRGRIYRIVPDGFQQRQLPKLGAATTTELVATLAHKNGWHRETASRLLYQRQDRRAIPQLEKLAATAALAEGRMHALYALDGLDALAAEVILPRLSDEHPRVREHAVRLSERVLADSPAVRDKLFTLVIDPEIRVRYQLAFTLGELRGPQRDRALASLLVRRDKTDDMLRTAVLSAIGESAGTVLAAVVENKSVRTEGHQKEMVQAICVQIGKQQRPQDVAAVLNILRLLKENEKSLLQTIVQGLSAKPGSPLAQQIALATGGQADKLLKALVADSRAAASNDKLKAEDRAQAIYQLQLAVFDDVQESLNEFLDPSQPSQVQSAAIDTLATYSSEEVAALVIARWPGLTPRIRRQAEDVLFSRTVWLSHLLAAVENNKVKLGDLDPGRLRLLSSHPDEGIRQHAKKVVAVGSVNADRAKVLKQYEAALKMNGDAARGKLAFKKVCAACHKVEGVGYEIGPNLAAMRNRGPEAILLNVFDPNREVNPQFLNYTVATTSGRVVTGMITAETANSITLTRADNKSDTILRIDIDKMRSSGASLMPEGLEKDVTQQMMADVIEYLKSIE